MEQKPPWTSWDSWAWEQGKRDLGKGGKAGFGKRRATVLHESGFPVQFPRAGMMSENQGIVWVGKDLSENCGNIWVGKDLP